MPCCELHGGTGALRRHEQHPNQPRGLLHSRCGPRSTLHFPHRSVKEQRMKVSVISYFRDASYIPSAYSRVAPANRLNTIRSRMLIAPAATILFQPSPTQVSSFRCVACEGVYQNGFTGFTLGTRRLLGPRGKKRDDPIFCEIQIKVHLLRLVHL